MLAIVCHFPICHTYPLKRGRVVVDPKNHLLPPLLRCYLISGVDIGAINAAAFVELLPGCWLNCPGCVHDFSLSFDLIIPARIRTDLIANDSPLTGRSPLDGWGKYGRE